jgi:hypothetical protein
LGDKHRFDRSRDVGPYLGLRPRRKQSGDHDPQLGITKAGNRYLRSLLVECANFTLGPFGQDSDLRRWGLRLAERGGKNARKRALWLPWPGSWPCCSTDCGSPKRNTNRFTLRRLPRTGVSERWICGCRDTDSR